MARETTSPCGGSGEKINTPIFDTGESGSSPCAGDAPPREPVSGFDDAVTKHGRNSPEALREHRKQLMTGRRAEWPPKQEKVRYRKSPWSSATNPVYEPIEEKKKAPVVNETPGSPCG